MNAEVSAEASEIVTMAVDKYQSSGNYEVPHHDFRIWFHIEINLKAASRLIKEMMDKRFGPAWHCCMGEGFGFEVTYQQRNLMYMYYGEKLGILLYKC